MSLEDYVTERPLPTIVDVAVDPRRWMAQANDGNGRAGVLLFKLGMSARSKGSGLSDLPREVSDAPLKWLEQAASQGDMEAKVLYALNANPRGLSGNRTDPAPDVLAHFQVKALRFLTEAASAGIEDAFQLLATGYDLGWFGAPDRIASSAYATALAELSPTPFRRARADAKSGALNTFDRGQAAEAARRIVTPFRSTAGRAASK